MPVALSTSGTRSSGNPLSSHRLIVLLLRFSRRASSAARMPFSANRGERCFVMGGDSCTTNNGLQAPLLRNPLTTAGPGIGMLATMPRKPRNAAVEAIYAKRQGRRPHYLARLMERYNVERRQMLEEIDGLDKSLLSRWLDEDKPSTPSPDWARKLGEFFGQGGDPVDIFADPDLDWMARFLQGRDREEVDRMKKMLEAAFPAKRA